MTCRITARSLLAIATATALLALTAAQAAPPPPRIVGTCNPTKIKYTLSLLTTSNTSGQAIPIPETSFTFVQAKAGCVIINFSGRVRAANAATDGAGIQPLLKNSSNVELNGRPFAASFFNATGFYVERTAQFVFPNVPAGNYTVRMELVSITSSNGAASVDSPNVVVHYQ